MFAKIEKYGEMQVSMYNNLTMLHFLFIFLIVSMFVVQ